ncbi:LppX_LprAFG lipoprotein [Kribbella sp. NPDC051587]|uniref:LppX_LprAFG lipoprotein n=1 Tax=Kribbella sp. NPDC051587 TaxID=3364119 RepID=UPI0037B384E4
MKFRAAVATAAVVPLALGLAACGGTDKPAAAPPAPVSVPTTAEPQKAVSTAPPAAVRLNRVTFVPAMNSALTKQKSWHIVGKMTGGGSTLLTMDGYQTANPTAMSMTMTGAAFQGKAAKIILVDKTPYLSLPGLTPAGKFAKILPQDAGNLAELMDSGDPTKIYKSFDKSMVNLKFVGEETVAGEKLERYAVTVNTAKALKAQGKKVPKGVPATINYSMWMDKSHLVRKVSFDLSGVSMVMTMSDYNKPVSITAPPANKIIK